MATETSTSALTRNAHLRVESERVLDAAKTLGRNLHPAAVAAVSDLMRVVNGHYSNLIEGHLLHPSDVERALTGRLSDDPDKRLLELEGVAHVEAERFVEAAIFEQPGRNVCEPEFVRAVHGEFYERIPFALRIAPHSSSDSAELAVPGEYRTFDVSFGDHAAPKWADVPQLMRQYADEHDVGQYFPGGYDADRVGALLNVTLGHHRLLWIHPFGDGNGRVARIITDAAISRAGAGGNGLWSLSRGFAFNRGDYFQRLADADRACRDSQDDSQEISVAARERLARFFLRMSAEQIAFMDGLLAPETLLDRVAHYCKLREEIVVGPNSTPLTGVQRTRGRPSGGFRMGTGEVLRALVLEGDIARSRVASIARVSAPTASRLVHSLVKEGFASIDARNQRVRVRFPAHALPYLFPSLVAAGA